MEIFGVSYRLLCFLLFRVEVVIVRLLCFFEVRIIVWKSMCVFIVKIFRTMSLGGYEDKKFCGIWERSYGFL